jgi:hypothetical protein
MQGYSARKIPGEDPHRAVKNSIHFVSCSGLDLLDDALVHYCLRDRFLRGGPIEYLR